MITSSSPCFKDISDQELLRDLKQLIVRDRKLEAELLAHLAEVDARKLYLKEGCSSMFVYCTEVLHFSEPVAYHRIAAARAARCYPALLERLGSGEIHLSGITLLAPHLTHENHVDLLDQAKHKSKRAIEALVADLRPRPASASYVRRLPPPKYPNVPAAAPRERSDVAPPSVAQPSSARAPKPLGAERFRIQFTATRATNDRLRELQALLRHQIPDGDLSQIFDRALELLLADVRRKKFAESCTPRAPRAVDGQPSRHIPADIKRQVANRDRNRCQYTTDTGRRCDSQDFLEFHHLEPWARARRHSVEGLRLMCRAHNQYEGERTYGRQHMQRSRMARTPTAPGGS